MRRFLLVVIVLILLFVGTSILMIGGDIYVHYAHPDGLTYAGFIMREVLFGIPDLLLIIANIYLYYSIITLTPYPKITGVFLLASSLHHIYGSITDLGVNQSLYIHCLSNVCGIIFGLVGLLKSSEPALEPA